MSRPVSSYFPNYLITILCVGFVFSVKSSNRKLMVVSFDAFKPVYFEQKITPFFHQFYTNGVRATRMNNSFPTKTFVNHFSIATGLFPQNHGVTGNEVYDREKSTFFQYSHELFHYNESVTPIWTLNERQGQRSGVMMWPGSDFPYNGQSCTFQKPLDKGMGLEDRVDMTMSWLTDSTNPTNFVMLYIEQPDEDGHAYSPDSQQEIDMVKRLDAFIVYLEQSLIMVGIHDVTDIIVLSDHGMSTVTPRNFIDLYKYIDGHLCKTYGSSPVLQIVCKNGKGNEACRNVTKASKVLGTFKAYTDEELLDRWHVRNQQRFGPCTVVAEPGYAFQDMNDLKKWFLDSVGVQITMDTPYGIHGYDNYDPDMRPIFMAKGPSFKKGVIVDDEFVNIDLYHLFCKLLHLNCIQVDGFNREKVWQKMLNNK